MPIARKQEKPGESNSVVLPDGQELSFGRGPGSPAPDATPGDGAKVLLLTSSGGAATKPAFARFGKGLPLSMPPAPAATEGEPEEG